MFLSPWGEGFTGSLTSWGGQGPLEVVSSTPLLQAGSSGTGCSGLCSVESEHLHRWRLYNLSGQQVLVSDHPWTESRFLFWMELLVFHFSLLPLVLYVWHHWETSLYLLDCLPLPLLYLFVLHITNQCPASFVTMPYSANSILPCCLLRPAQISVLIPHPLTP